MKIMYVGCNPAGAADLLMDSEITELARLFRRRTGEPVDFVPYPRLPIEDLPLVIADEQPDVLHIAAHAGDGRLMFANVSGGQVELTGVGLSIYLKVPSPPTLVYLNACNSHEIAQALTTVVSVAIGTTSVISNRTARASATLFYDRILTGATVKDAFEAGQVTMAAMQSETLSSRMYVATGTEPSSLRLHRSPCLIARFVDDNYSPDDGGDYEIQFGVAGCPSNTSQVVFFSDETSEEKLKDVCSIVRGTPVRNIFWDDDDDKTEEIYGDYRAYATGTTTAGAAFTVASTACLALEAYFKLAGIERDDIPEAARIAIANLRSKDGANVPSREVFDKEPRLAKKGSGKAKKK